MHHACSGGVRIIINLGKKKSNTFIGIYIRNKKLRANNKKSEEIVQFIGDYSLYKKFGRIYIWNCKQKWTGTRTNVWARRTLEPPLHAWWDQLKSWNSISKISNKMRRSYPFLFNCRRSTDLVFLFKYRFDSLRVQLANHTISQSFLLIICKTQSFFFKQSLFFGKLKFVFYYLQI